jgi:hypothetical protein
MLAVLKMQILRYQPSVAFAGIKQTYQLRWLLQTKEMLRVLALSKSELNHLKL